MLGPDAKIHVNTAGTATPFGGITLAVVSGRWRAYGDRVDTSDSQSGGVKANMLGLLTLEAQITAHQASDVNPFAGNLVNLDLANIIALTIDITGYAASPPAGSAIAAMYVFTPNFRILEASGDWQIQGSPAQNIVFSGESTVPVPAIGSPQTSGSIILNGVAQVPNITTP